MVLPPGFRFGVATSAFQTEGGFNGPGEPANNWLDWEFAGRVPGAGRALDFWNRYEEILDKAQEVGCDTFRLSVEWARCEPSPGHVDKEAFARYRAILRACHQRGIEPVVALHHFTHPDWLGRDLWLQLDAPDRFAAWAATAVDHLGDECHRWLTINEINALAFGTYFTGALPPGGLGRTGDVVRALGHLVAGHVLAYSAVHWRQPEAVVSTNNHAVSVYELDRLLIDVLLGRSRGVERHEMGAWLTERRRAYHAALPAAGLVERAMRAAAASILPLDQAFPRAVSEVYRGPYERPLDVVQVNYYDPVASHRIRWPGRRTVGGRSWSPFRQIWDDAVHPEGLGLYCRLNHEPGLDLWVADNGLCNRVRAGHGYPRLDGWDRVRYLGANLLAVAEAVDEGLPITRYFHWTLSWPGLCARGPSPFGDTARRGVGAPRSGGRQGWSPAWGGEAADKHSDL
ncbi:MAG: family 1 glycosylhydrolase [Actinobacteria bacterium]|nr:family 1 glycosylhydrolase [Actinomycetota bacterium]